MDSRLRTLLLVAALGFLAWFLFLRKGGETPPQDLHVDATPPTADARGAGPENFTLESGNLLATVSTYSGAIKDLRLRGTQFEDSHHQPEQLSQTTNETFYPLRSNVVFERDGHNVLPDYLTFTPVRHSNTEIELVAQPPGTDLEVRRSVTAATNYSFRVATQVINHGAPGRLRYSQGVYHYVRRSEESGGFFRQSWQRAEGLCNYDNDKLFRAWRDDLGKRGYANDAVSPNAHYVGVGNVYFLFALVPTGPDRASCHLRAVDRGGTQESPEGSAILAQLSYPPVQLATGATQEYSALSYFGPKYTPALVAAAPVLRDSVNLGFFSIIARGLLKLLQFLYGLVHNWGVAIILLTVVVRIALFPLLARSIKSMAVMQKLKPELDALNEKYADNQEQKGLATMELYRKYGVNPFASCLPQLAQLPVWWALYATLQTSVELYHAPFFGWVRDLSQPDIAFHIPVVGWGVPILPLILGGVMFLQQKIMPPSMPDPAQAKMMLYFMPIFLTAISFFLPSGLALYMLTNSALGIVQQKITKTQLDRLSGPPSGGSGAEIEVRPTETALAAPGGASGGKSGKNGGRRGGRR